MTKYAIGENKPSEMFLQACRGGGASHISCNCGRMHYAPMNLYYSDDETDYQCMLDNALEEQKANPDGVIINYTDDFISASDIDGRTFVDDCPCNGLYRYEQWIWNNKNTIRDYLKARIEQEFKWAEEQLTLNKLAGISK